MEWSKRCCVLICVLALVMPAIALAGRGGPPSGGGWGGGGGKSDEGVLYGDLYVVLRDGNGKPVFDPDNHNCPQPVYIDGAGDCQVITMVYDEETYHCEVPEAFVDLVVSVESGRLNMSRTTDKVLDHAYAEAIKNITYADSITLDPAFRLLLTFVDPVTDESVEKTIDSPLENLSMYQKLMKYGYFPLAEVSSHDPADTSITIYDPSANLEDNGLGWLAVRSEDLEDPEVPVIQPEDLQSAVSFIAAGADKSGRITTDMLVNVNANLGINVLDNTVDPPTMTYFDFDPFGLTYHHQNKYGQVPDVDLLLDPYILDGGFPEGETWFQVGLRNIVSEVPFEDVLGCKKDDIKPSGPQGEFDFFTQAADDARAVIEFLHNWSIPEYTLPQ